MGIVGGCLGPKRTRDEIYVKLITEMHEQAHKITHNENLDIYMIIRQKLIKKGLLRKFMDNLSYHRHKILESLNYNYKCTGQSKEIQRYYTGLVIADSVLEIAYPHTPQQLQQGSIAIQERSVDSYNTNPHQVMLNKQIFGSKKYVMNFDPERRYEVLEQNRIAYDQQYLRLVLFLYENCGKMYDRLLQSLTQFCIKHPGVIGCQSHVWKIIDKLMQAVNKLYLIPKSISVINLLITRTKDQANEHLRNTDTLISIIKVWLHEKQSDTMLVQSAQTLANSQQIIHTYFDRCLSSWYSMFLYEVIFVMYDSVQFQQPQQLYLEKLFEKILEHSDFKGTFFRGLFNYLLGYVCVVGMINTENKQKQKQKQKQRQRQVEQGYKKLFANSLGLSYQKIKMQYKNILKDNVKIQCFKLLNTWIDKQYTDIDQLCYYNSKSLIFVYICNAKYYIQCQQYYQGNHNNKNDRNYNSSNSYNKSNGSVININNTNGNGNENSNENVNGTEYQSLYVSPRKNNIENNKNRSMLDCIMDQYFGVIMKMGGKTRKFFIERVFDDFREQNLSKIQYQLLFKLIKQIIYRNTLDQLKSPTTPLTPSKTKSFTQFFQLKYASLLQQHQQQQQSPISPRLIQSSQHKPKQQQSFTPLQSDFQLYLIPILTKYDHTLKLQILKMLGYIIQTRGTMILSQQGRYKLCQLMFSLYQNIVSIGSIREGYQFVCAVLSVLRVLVNVGGWNGKRVRAWSLAQINVRNQAKDQQGDNGGGQQKTAINFQVFMSVYIQKIYDQVLSEQNQMKLPVHAHYMLVYLIQQIKLMININSTNSSNGNNNNNSNNNNNNNNNNNDNKMTKNNKDDKQIREINARRQKINQINSRIPIKQHKQQQSELIVKEQLELINSMKQFLIQYYLSNPILSSSSSSLQQQQLKQQRLSSPASQSVSLLTMTQQQQQQVQPLTSCTLPSPSSQQKQQYKNLLNRLFIPQSLSSSQQQQFSRTSITKNHQFTHNNYSNNRMNRSVRNSQSLSLRSMSIQSLHRCAECKMMESCSKCKELNGKWKHDDSFREIIDIVQI